MVVPRHRSLSHFRFLAAAILIASVNYGCETPSAPVAPPPEIAPPPAPAPVAVAIPEGNWELVNSNFVGAGRIPGVPRATIAFKDGQLSAHSGCNSAAATARDLEGRLEVGPLATTRRDCPEPLKTFEARFFKLLRAQPVLRFEGERLTLAQGDLNASFRRVATLDGKTH